MVTIVSQEQINSLLKRLGLTEKDLIVCDPKNMVMLEFQKGHSAEINQPNQCGGDLPEIIPKV
jgi:hypothetical protein